LKQVPLTVVVSILLLVLAAWPAIQSWAVVDATHHLLYHLLFAASGGVLGLQTAWWMHQSENTDVASDEPGVSS